MTTITLTVESIARKVKDMEEYHSRFDPDHYSECQPCYEDHLDFMQDQESDARLDAMIEQEEYEEALI